MKWESMEIRRSLMSKPMMVGLVLCFLCLLYGGKDHMNMSAANFLDVFIFAQTDGTTCIIAILFPLLAVLPAGTAYRSERQQGYYALVCQKMGFMRYCRMKLWNSFLCGTLVLGIPHLLFFFVCILSGFGQKMTGQNVAISFLPQIYQQYPVMYGFILVANSALCGAVFSILGLGISAWVTNKYIAAFLPFAYYVFSGVVLIEIHPAWNAITLFSLNQYAKADMTTILVYDSLLLATGIFLFFTGVDNDDQIPFFA